MEAAGGRPTGSLAALAVGLALALGGCAAPQACYCRGTAGNAASTSAYTVACPDVIELNVASRPDLSGRATIEPGGAISFGSGDRLRVDGLTPDEIAENIAIELPCSRSAVQVRVAEYVSRQLFLCGPVEGEERAVPYQGPEVVVDFLHRVGGLPREAEPRDVHVVRANVALGRRPEVFNVDLKAILLQNDAKTNVILEPYDQVYIGESARSCWMRCLPPWMHLRGPGENQPPMRP
jgi:polysaccharide biosynthesis/export protein